MIRKIVGCLLAVLRGAACSLLEQALSPRHRVTTPLAPGVYLYLALSTYHSYDVEQRSRAAGRFAALADEWSGAVAQQAEQFAWQTITQDIVDMDLNRLPPLDELLAVRDAAYKMRRPQSVAEDSHLPSMKEYKPLEMGKALSSKCSEMTVFLRLLRVHNWAIRELNLQENSKALLEMKNGTLASHATEETDGQSLPQDIPDREHVQEGDLNQKMSELEGSADGWIYTSLSSMEAQDQSRKEGRKRTRPWEEGGESHTTGSCE
ncbi:hypothetical protein STCU_07718 [Strigomonas culicis]|nr:hypothetical protein STCU_07718 [Strigomonas culicis]|eukprot:EPY23427.1 hypothetical protein STCU_07718 [Strigomonas culicis]